MILEKYGTDREGNEFNHLLDDIKEASISNEGISILRNDDSENYHKFDSYDNEAIYLLNDQGKTLRKLTKKL